MESRLVLVFVAGLWTVTWGAARHNKMSGEGRDDASDVTWAHAVNSRDALEKALAGPIHFLEADISMGHVDGSSGFPPVPIMAHPPDTTSDLTLEDWLHTVATKRPEKGIKLDFKSLAALEPSLMILQRYAPMLNGSLWLGADVLPGPIHPKTEPLRSDYFLAMCDRYFPRATLSLGWTTYWIRRFPVTDWKYEWQHVRQMADTIRCWYGKRKYPPIAFNVRGIFASRSIKQLQWLLATIPHSSLLIWTAPNDQVDAEDFLKVQKSFPADRLYFDVPRALYKPYTKFRGSSGVLPKKHFKDNERWTSVTRTQDRTCEMFTYTDGDFVLFGRPSNTAVLQKSLLAVDSLSNFTLTGRLKFFAGEQMLSPSDWQHSLKLVLANVDRLPKHAATYSKKKKQLVLNVWDPDVLWTAVNSSALYTFRHTYFQDGTACRMFRLRINGNLSFDAWTIPCDPTYEDYSYREVSEGSLSEVSLEENFEAEEGLFFFGFHSQGDEYVLLYDLEAVETTPSDLPSLQLAFTSSGNKPEYILWMLVALFSWICL